MTQVLHLNLAKLNKYRHLFLFLQGFFCVCLWTRYLLCGTDMYKVETRQLHSGEALWSFGAPQCTALTISMSGIEAPQP